MSVKFKEKRTNNKIKPRLFLLLEFIAMLLTTYIINKTLNLTDMVNLISIILLVVFIVNSIPRYLVVMNRINKQII